MTNPAATTLYDAMEATWSPAAQHRVGPWLIRDGKAGGKRVSAATTEGPFELADLHSAEAAMRALDQTPLFMIRAGEDALDQMLDEQGYRIIDPVVLYVVPVEKLTQSQVLPVSAFQLWPPLAIMADIWSEGGIGPDRLAVMDRVTGSKTAVLARHRDQPAGAAFVAIHGDIAVIHAIEVVPAQRRQGVGSNILCAAAHWAQENCAAKLGLAVTRANAGANTLYTSQGMQVVGHYHYRIK